MFARCGVCDNKRQLRDSHLVGSTNYVIFDKAYKMHLAQQEAHRNAYYGTRYMSVSHPEKCVTIIHKKWIMQKQRLPILQAKTRALMTSNRSNGYDRSWSW
jgi:hypothetical protein